jgi:hypothetical protein
MAASALRVPATNRTLVWFSGEAERRRRTAAAQEELSRRAAAESGWVGFSDRSYAEIRTRAQARRAAYMTAVLRRGIAWLGALPRRSPTAATSGLAGGISARAAAWQHPELFGYVALAALALAIAGPMLNAAATRPCQTEPALFRPEGDLTVKMTVSHNAACAIWAKAENISMRDLTITMAPQHGTLALRGRTGVTYRAAGQFSGEDFFAFALRGTRDGRDQVSVVRVPVTVN